MKSILFNLLESAFNVNVWVLATLKSASDLSIITHLSLLIASFLLKMADVCPGVLNNGNFSIVQCLNIRVGKLNQHWAIESVPIHALDFSFNGNFCF